MRPFRNILAILRQYVSKIRVHVTDAAQSTPRWVKVFGIIALVLAVLVVVMLATGRGGSHGPGRHAPSADTTPSVGTGRHTPPAGSHTRP